MRHILQLFYLACLIVYSDIEFDQENFKINVRPEFQVGGGGRIDLFINVMSTARYRLYLLRCIIGFSS